ADIFSVNHKRVSFLNGLSPTLKTLLQKGRPFIMHGAGHRPAGSPQSLPPAAPAQGELSERPWLKIGEFSNTNSNRNSFSGFVADASLPARSRDPSTRAGWSLPAFPQADFAKGSAVRSGLR